jgi:hypothetical protein
VHSDYVRLASRVLAQTPLVQPNIVLLPEIVGAAAGGTVGLLGVFWGCEYVSSTTGEKIFSNSWPGSGADSNHPIKAFVYDNPNQTFVIASSASLTSEATARGHVFANANFAAATSGVSSTGISSATLRIVGIQDDPENQDFTAAGIPVIVRLNNSFNSGNGAIVAGTVANTGV